MAEAFFWFFLSFFSIYGLLSIIAYICNLISDVRIMRGKTVFTVIAVKNEEEKIEGIINSLLLKVKAADSGISDQRIIAVDMGSTDGTADIVKRMERENRGVSLMSAEEFENKLRFSIVN